MLFRSEDTADRTIEEFDKVFIKKEIPDEIPELMINEENMKLTELLTFTKLSDSNSNARRLIEQGAVSINGKKVTDVNLVPEIINGMILKVGKRKFLKVLK